MLKLMRRINYWKFLVYAISLTLLFPFIALILISFGDTDGLWAHLFATVLIKYVANTLALMLGVAFLSGIFGVLTAWIISKYHFVFSKYIDFMLLLPAACPAYLVAYAYTDFFEYAGPVQGSIRSLMGWSSARDYYFPEIRSLGGAIFVLSSVLYPYIYLLARTAFRQIPESYIEVSSLYKRSEFWTIGFPLARPAIAAGVALVSMEVVSDFGTVEYFSLQTLTLGIFNVWIGMNSITAAAQLATCSFAFIIILLVLEMRSRSGRRFNDTSKNQRYGRTKSLVGLKATFCVTFCLLPFCFGFLIPISILISNLVGSFKWLNLMDSLVILRNTLMLSLIGASLIMLIATLIGSVSQVSSDRKLQNLVSFSSTGYAFPGTILALGVMIFFGFIDNILVFTEIFGLNLYLSGTLIALLFAYLIRFLAVGYGSVLSGLSKTSPNLVWASRTLGLSFSSTITKISIPLIKKSIIAGGVLVFVDIMKELPMTLLLRPFNFDTLATSTYQFAHDELMTEASLPALLIVLSGLIPIVFLNRLLKKPEF